MPKSWWLWLRLREYRRQLSACQSTNVPKQHDPMQHGQGNCGNIKENQQCAAMILNSLKHADVSLCMLQLPNGILHKVEEVTC